MQEFKIGSLIAPLGKFVAPSEVNVNQSLND